MLNDLIKAREANHASKRHIEDLRSGLNRFASAFQRDVHTIRPAQVQDFLLAIKLSPRSMNNFRMVISNLFSHAKLRGHAAKDFDPLEHIPWAKESDGEVEIYSPDDLKVLLQRSGSPVKRDELMTIDQVGNRILVAIPSGKPAVDFREILREPQEDYLVDDADLPL